MNLTDVQTISIDTFTGLVYPSSQRVALYPERFIIGYVPTTVFGRTKRSWRREHGYPAD